MLLQVKQLLNLPFASHRWPSTRVSSRSCPGVLQLSPPPPLRYHNTSRPTFHSGLKHELLKVHQRLLASAQAAAEQLVWRRSGAANQPHPRVVQLVDERDEAARLVTHLRADARGYRPVFVCLHALSTHSHRASAPLLRPDSGQASKSLPASQRINCCASRASTSHLIRWPQLPGGVGQGGMHKGRMAPYACYQLLPACS